MEGLYHIILCYVTLYDDIILYHIVFHFTSFHFCPGWQHIVLVHYTILHYTILYTLITMYLIF